MGTTRISLGANAGSDGTMVAGDGRQGGCRRPHRFSPTLVTSEKLARCSVGKESALSSDWYPALCPQPADHRSGVKQAPLSHVEDQISIKPARLLALPLGASARTTPLKQGLNLELSRESRPLTRWRRVEFTRYSAPHRPSESSSTAVYRAWET